MSTALQNKHRLRLTTETQVSAYDRISSLLLAAVIVVGLMVVILFMIWLTLVAKFSSQTTVNIVEDLAGNDNRPEGIADDWQEPGVEDFPEVEKPQLATALEAVTDAVSSVQAQLEKYDGDALQMGRGPGLGDKRQRGPGRGGSNAIPPWDRWQIEYTAGTQAEYLAILESFDITLGSVRQVSNRIDYVDQLTAGTPAVSEGVRKDEKRIYFHNRKNRLRRWDTNKVASAGVNTENAIIVQFYEPAVVEQLKQLEAAYFQREGRTLEEVQQTLFRVRPAGGGYEYYVEDITYRTVPKG